MWLIKWILLATFNNGWLVVEYFIKSILHLVIMGRHGAIGEDNELNKTGKIQSSDFGNNIKE